MFKKYILYVSVMFSVFCLISSLKAEEGLVGWWKFNEGTGNILHDSSGNGNDGKIYGATWIKGNTGIALLFDGKDDYVVCGNDTSLQIDGSLTISAWIKVSSETDNRWYIASKGSYKLSLIHGEPKEVRYFSALRPVFTVKKEVWPDEIEVQFPEDLPNRKRISKNKWVYIAAVASIENKIIEIYVDGKLMTSKEWLEDAIFHSDRASLLIGTESFNSNHFTGLIGETKIYNRSLSSEEIERNYELERQTKD